MAHSVDHIGDRHLDAKFARACAHDVRVPYSFSHHVHGRHDVRDPLAPAKTLPDSMVAGVVRSAGDYEVADAHAEAEDDFDGLMVSRCSIRYTEPEGADAAAPTAAPTPVPR